jgi:hypothetical protein
MNYWFGLKRTNWESLKGHQNSFCAFELGSCDRVLLVPFSVLARYLDGFWTSPDADGGISHWHVRLANADSSVVLLADRDRGHVDLTEFLLKG